MPVIGNGDALTYYEANKFREDSGCATIMIGRGALIKPWIFYECEHNTTLMPTAEERVRIYRKLAMYMKEHFHDDERGRRSAFNFLPWHLSFLCRYRPLPYELFKDTYLDHRLIQNSRIVDDILCEAYGEPDPLEKLLRCENEDAHVEIANVLWDAPSDEEAVSMLKNLAKSGTVEQWENTTGRRTRGEEPDRG